MRRTSGSRGLRWAETAAAIALAAGAWGAVGAVPAQAALDPSVLEAVDVPEVAQAARDIAALLENIEAGAEEQEIAAALHRFLADSVHEDSVLEDALAVVLAGDWNEEQLAALRSLFAEYAPLDLKAPGGGDEAAPPPRSTLSRAEEDPEAEDAASKDVETGRLERQGFDAPPPPPAGGGGSSDYRP